MAIIIGKKVTVVGTINLNTDFFSFRLTGVEGDLLRVQVSLTLDRKHLD